MQKSQLIAQAGISSSQFNRLVQMQSLEIKDAYTEEEAQMILKGAQSMVKQQRQPSQSNSGSIVASSQKRTQIAKRESMAQAVQDAQESNRVYAETFLTVLNAGTEEFTDSLTQHLGGMRENLLAVEDDADFLSQLMQNGCGGQLPTAH